MHRHVMNQLSNMINESAELVAFRNRQERNQRWKENAINFGGIVLATYVGTMLTQATKRAVFKDKN